MLILTWRLNYHSYDKRRRGSPDIWQSIYSIEHYLFHGRTPSKREKLLQKIERCKDRLIHKSHALLLWHVLLHLTSYVRSIRLCKVAALSLHVCVSLFCKRWHIYFHSCKVNERKLKKIPDLRWRSDRRQLQVQLCDACSNNYPDSKHSLLGRQVLGDSSGWMDNSLVPHELFQHSELH